MEPAQVPYGSGSRLKVLGTFLPKLLLQLDGTPQTTVLDSFQVQINNQDATDVRFLGPTELEVGMPPIKETGRYSVRVIDPRGVEATLRDAVQVVLRDPVKLVFTNAPRTTQPGTWTQPPIVMELRDPSDNLAGYSQQTLLRIKSDSPSGLLSLNTAGDLNLNAGPVLSLLVPGGTSDITVNFQAPNAGIYTITATLGTLPPISQQVVVQEPVAR